MKLLVPATAGTMESSDIQINIEPRDTGGIQVDLTSNVMNQFGRQILDTIKTVLGELGIENAYVIAIDRGALDCTIKARVSAAVYRSAQNEDYQWRTKECLRKD